VSMGCKESNAPSVNSPVMDEETMKPDHRLGLVIRVSFRALTLFRIIYSPTIGMPYILCSTRHKIGHFGDVLPSQSLGFS